MDCDEAISHSIPSNLYELIQKTFEEKNNNPNESYANNLLKVLKKYHMWPSLQIKKFKNNNDLVLLHNSYYVSDVEEQFKNIYDQCRSVVLDFSKNINENIVVSYANNIPIRMDINVYSKDIAATDKYQEAYDGTMVTVYYYNNEWHFGTSTCTDINYSKFSHPTKTHGEMLNEVIMYIYRSHFTDEDLALPKNVIEQKLRDIFTCNLDTSCAYEFVMLHHENNHIIDYSDIYGPEYKYLYHINTKNRNTLELIDISNCPYSNIGIVYPRYFNSIDEAYTHITTNKSYGFIVKKVTNDGIKLLKISPKEIDFKEETDPCKPNVWHNILAVYMKNRKDFKICDYINLYVGELQLPKDEKGREIDPTYLVHTMISTIKDVLYNLYIATTTYNTKTNRFKMNKDLDMQFPPIIRFHLAQLRHRQQYYHQRALLRPTDVYYYICQCNSIKNIKMLIQFFATSIGYNITERSSMCMSILNSLL